MNRYSPVANRTPFATSPRATEPLLKKLAIELRDREAPVVALLVERERAAQRIERSQLLPFVSAVEEARKSCEAFMSGERAVKNRAGGRSGLQWSRRQVRRKSPPNPQTFQHLVEIPRQTLEFSGQACDSDSLAQRRTANVSGDFDNLLQRPHFLARDTIPDCEAYQARNRQCHSLGIMGVIAPYGNRSCPRLFRQRLCRSRRFLEARA